MAGLTQDDIAHFLHANDKLLDSVKLPELQIISQIPLISSADIDWIEVRPSKYGNGLFATKDIPANRCITLYPTHQIAYKVLKEDNEWQVISPQGEPTYYRDYSLDVSDQLKIAGIPYLIHNLLFVGHILNDPCPDVNIQNKEEWIARYDQLDPNAEYRHIKDLWMGIFSTRDIKAGEELFSCYGTTYWLGRA